MLWGAGKGNLEKIFLWQKKAVRALAKLAPQAHCREFFKQFKILTVPNLFILESICYVTQNKIHETIENNSIHRHSYNTRHKNLFAQQHRLAMFEKKTRVFRSKIVPGFAIVNKEHSPIFKI